MKRFYFWILSVIFLYGVIELLSYGGLFILNKYRNLPYEPVDVISARHSNIINSYIEQKTDFWSFSPTLGWSIKKNGSSPLYQANSAGLRSSREYAATPPPGVLRVSTFGNSFTFCADVKNDHTWQAMMERYFPNVEVLNFGVYGLDQAFLRYLEEGQQYQSHIVLIGFMPENIFRNVNTYRPFYFSDTGTPLAKPRFVLNQGKLSLIPNPMKSVQDYKNLLLHPQEVLPELGIHDYYYSRRYKSNKFDWSPTARLATIMIEEGKTKAAEEDGIITAQFRYNEKSEAFNVTKKIFDEFYQASLRNNSIPIILIHPTEPDFGNHQRQNIKRYEPLLAYFESAGYQYIDLMGALEQAKSAGYRSEELFMPHYSPFANIFIAKFILNYLIKMSNPEN